MITVNYHHSPIRRENLQKNSTGSGDDVWRDIYRLKYDKHAGLLVKSRPVVRNQCQITRLFTLSTCHYCVTPVPVGFISTHQVEWLHEPCEKSSSSGFLFQLKGRGGEQMNHSVAFGGQAPLTKKKRTNHSLEKEREINASALRTVDLSLLFSQWHGSFSRFEPVLFSLGITDSVTQKLNSLWWVTPMNVSW